MEQSFPNSQELRAYLLGLERVSEPGTPTNPQLEQPGNDALEDRIFTEDAVYRALEQEREALIDDFVSGFLTPEETSILEEQCRLSASLREMVTERRNLVAALELRQHRTRRSAWTLRRPKPWTLIPSIFSVAACLVLAVVLLHRSPAPTPPKQAAGAPLASPPAATPSPGVKVFFLADLVTRGVSRAPVLKVPAATAAVDLQVEIRNASPGSPWKMELLHGKTTIWGAEGKVENVGGLSLLTAHLDASTLQSGNFTLVARTDAGENRLVRRAFVVEQIP
jgi:hypothetical protein